MWEGMTVYSTPEDFQQPIVQFHNASRLYRLIEDYTQEWGAVDFRKRFFMAGGYEYDGASVPWFVPPAIAPQEKVWLAGSLWHDRGTQEKGEWPHPDLFRFETKINGIWRPDLGPGWHRQDWDNFLGQCGRMAGAPEWQCRMYVAAVKVYPVNWFKNF
jgi:hypothetical protein